MKSNIGYIVFLLTAGILIQSSCKKDATIDIHRAPFANAGPDQTIQLPTNSVLLDGKASMELDGKVNTYLWSKISGPASFVIDNPNALITSIKNLEQGIYLIEWKVTDYKGLSASDTIQITVIDPSHTNRPPNAQAGADQIIISPVNNTTLNGSNSNDPDNDILHFQWIEISGSTANILNPNAIETQVSYLGEGVYQFELKVTDPLGLFSKDTTQITVITQSCINSTRPQINAQLIPIGTLSQARTGMAVASAGNKIVFAGAALSANNGSSVGDYGSSVVDIYDISTQTWTTAKLSEQRSDIAAIAAGNKIFFAGGRLGDGAFDRLFSTIDIYDVSRNSWSVASLSEPRAYIAAAAVGDKVLFAGGEKDWNYTTSNKVDIYDPWTLNMSTTTLSEPRAFISAVTLDNKVYFAGGQIEDRWYADPSRKIDIYDNATNTWSTSLLNQPLGFVMGIGVMGKIYWAGGCTVEIKDVNTWNSTITQLSKPMDWINIDAGQNAIVKNNKIVFPFYNNNQFDIYDITTNTWSIGVLNQNITGASIISVNNIIYVAGGFINDDLSNQVFKLEF